MTDYEAFLAQHQSDIESMELPCAYGRYVHVPHGATQISAGFPGRSRLKAGRP